MASYALHTFLFQQFPPNIPWVNIELTSQTPEGRKRKERAQSLWLQKTRDFIFRRYNNQGGNKTSGPDDESQLDLEAQRHSISSLVSPTINGETEEGEGEKVAKSVLRFRWLGNDVDFDPLPTSSSLFSLDAHETWPEPSEGKQGRRKRQDEVNSPLGLSGYFNSNGVGVVRYDRTDP